MIWATNTLEQVASNRSGPREMFEAQISLLIIPSNVTENLAHAMEKNIVDPEFVESATIGGADTIKEQCIFKRWPAKNGLELFFLRIDGTLPLKPDAGADK